MNSRIEQLQRAFTEMGIGSLVPGFYDDPAFFKAEDSIPNLLDYYAEYCLLVTTDTAYREIAEQSILRVTSFLSPLLAAENINGRCMPTTLLLQRFLDNEGIWNFPLKGGIVVRFPSESQLRPKLLPPEPAAGGTHGHAWIVAPPFQILDLTISRQFYSPEEQGYVQRDLKTKEAIPEATDAFLANGEPSSNILALFPPLTASLDSCLISYYPRGVGGPTETFAEMKHPVLDSFKPFDLYQRFIKWKQNQPV